MRPAHGDEGGFMRTALLVLLMLVGPSVPAYAMDGTLWKQLDELSRIAYVKGVLDGIFISPELLLETPGSFGDSNDEIQTRSQASLAAREKLQKYVGTLKVNDVVAGVNALYADYRNQRIDASRIVYVALHQIGGMSNEVAEGYLASLRKLAAQ
jgi:hypothetical protein